MSVVQRMVTDQQDRVAEQAPIVDLWQPANQKHYGPGAHPSGSEQSVHGGGGGTGAPAKQPYGEPAEQITSAHSGRRVTVNGRPGKLGAVFGGKFKGRAKVLFDDGNFEEVNTSDITLLPAVAKQMLPGERARRINAAMTELRALEQRADMDYDLAMNDGGASIRETKRKQDALRAELAELRGLNVPAKLAERSPYGEPAKPKSSAGTPRKLREIAREIRKTWPKPYFGAVPYIDAMQDLDSIDDDYGQDSADSIVRYFLGNARNWRGPDAQRIKEELNALLKR